MKENAPGIFASGHLFAMPDNVYFSLTDVHKRKIVPWAYTRCAKPKAIDST